MTDSSPRGVGRAPARPQSLLENVWHRAPNEGDPALIWGQVSLLERIARGEDLRSVLEALAEFMEERCEEGVCTIQVLEAGPEERIHTLGGPGVKGSVVTALGEALNAGELLTARRAIRDRQTVIAPRIEDAEEWPSALKQAAEAAGIRSAWSTPILGTEGSVLGAFTLLYPTSGGPPASDLQLSEITTHIAGIAIERARRDRQLRTSRERYRVLYDDNPATYFTVGKDGTIRSVNAFGASQIGFDAEELVGQHFLDLYPEEARGRVGDHLRQCLQRPGEVVRWEARKVRGADRPLWVRESGRATETVDGDDVILVVSEDMTAEREKERRFSALVESSRDIISIFDDRWTLTYINPATREVLGYDPESLVGTKLRTLVHPDDRTALASAAERLIEHPGGEMSLEYRMESAHGEWVHLESIYRNLLDDPAVEGIVVNSRDITDRKRAERARERLQRSERLASLGELAASVAHEVNNPLSSVLTLCNLLLHAPEESLQEEGREEIELIEQEARRATDIMNDLLSFAREAESGEREQIELGRVVRDSLESRSYGLRTSNIEVTLAVENDLPKVVADERQIGQVFANLIENAKYALRQEGGGQIKIDVREVEGEVVVEVTDSGPGIPEEMLPRIFDPFSTTKGEEGTGLGLSVSMGIVQEHDGELEAENREGGGARFTLSLPIPSGEQGEVDQGSALAATDDPPARSPRKEEEQPLVLIVDDEEIFRSATGRSLEIAYDVRVETTGYAEAAIKAVETGRCDVLVTDVRMPGMSGPELWKMIQERRPSFQDHVIFMTADAMSPDTRRFLESTGAEVVTKPFEIEELIVRIAALLNGA